MFSVITIITMAFRYIYRVCGIQCRYPLIQSGATNQKIVLTEKSKDVIQQHVRSMSIRGKLRQLILALNIVLVITIKTINLVTK